MPYFAFMGFDHPPHSMPLRDKLRAEHRAYVKEHDQTMRFAGALYDNQGNQCGSLMIFETDNAAQVWDWFHDEPFFKGGVYKDSHVIEWRLAFNQFELTGWP
jgi:uncharacterized protein YciI